LPKLPKLFFPLHVQIFLIFALNIVVLGLAAVCLRTNAFHWGWEQLIYEPIQQRFQGVAFMTHHQLESLPKSSWTSALDDVGKIYGVKVYLFDITGKQLAGEPLELPPAVKTAVQKDAEFFLALRGPNNIAVPAGPDAMPPPPVRPHRGFLLHTDNPGLYWIGTGMPPMITHRLAEGLPLPTRVFIAPPGMPQEGFLGIGPDAPMQGDFVFGAGTAAPGAPLMQPPAVGFEMHGPGRRFPDTSLVLLASAPNLWTTPLFADFGMLSLIAGAILVGSFLLWWPYVHGITTSLRKVTIATERIAEGKFDKLPTIKRPDEIGRLSQAVENMAERLQRLIFGQKRFLGDTAHELGAPIARLQVALELLNATDQSERDRALADIKEDVEHMRLLINELLAFSRAALQKEPISLVSLDCKTLLEATIDRLSMNYPIELHVPGNLRVMGDEILLERAFGNVLRNAQRYAATGDPFEVTAQKAGASVVFQFADRGPGVPADSLRMLEEPFYRPESSRSRESGGVGLGLAIVKTCVETCGGTVAIRNREPHGLLVEIELAAEDEASVTSL
jgi:two-component system sensor histidine kinase CpxA